MQILCNRRASHILEYELEALKLRRTAMLRGPKHRQRLMVVGETLISKLMPLVVLMNFRVNDDILHFSVTTMAYCTPIARPYVKKYCFNPIRLCQMRLTALQRTQRSLQLITFVKAARRPFSVQLSTILAERS